MNKKTKLGVAKKIEKTNTEVAKEKDEKPKKTYLYTVTVLLNDETIVKSVDDVFGVLSDIKVPDIISGFTEITILNNKTGQSGFRQLKNFETQRVFNDPISLRILADTLS